MAAFLGYVTGGVIIIYLLSLLIEWALMKRILESPAQGIPASVAAAVVLAVILYGFGNANDGSWNPLPGGLGYVAGGVIVWLARMVAWRRRESRNSGDDLAETFE
jgi:heme A synthase